MVSRYYDAGTFETDNIELTDSQAHHLVHVKRAKLGERIELFNGRGKAVRAEVIELKKKSAVLQIVQQDYTDEDDSITIEIILASAVPKGDRFRWLIEKATEIGVTRFIPLITKNSVVSPRETKLEKHRQYVIEACKQSGRNHLMDISNSQTLEELCRELQDKQTTQIFIGHPRGDVAPITQLQNGLSGEVASLVLVIGPEGGFAPEEYDLLEKNHALPVCCSPHVLRIETAGLALASLAVSVVNEKLTNEKTSE